MKSISENYLNHSTDLHLFYKYPPQALDFLQIIKNKQFSQEKREILHKVICTQYGDMPISEKTRKNRELLLNKNTYTITTAHQLGLFGGPLYTLYKVLTTIKLADELNLKYTNYQFVPIFWIHTEDHDFAEINHFYENFIEKKEYKATFSGPVGEHILTEEILALIPQDFPQKWKNAYRKGIKMVDAYRAFMNEVLGEYGILMLDSNEKSLKQFFKPVVVHELTKEISAKCIEKANTELAKLSYHPQIQAREINLFYMTQNMRNRIVKKGNIYEVLNTSLQFTEEEILQLVENEPEKFSPNVCLRPLYQEMILPNLIYFGGWAEVRYWLQLKGVFDYFSENFPAVLPRMGATIFREAEAQTWERVGLALNQIELPIKELNEFLLCKSNLWNNAEWDSKINKTLNSVEDAEIYAKSINPDAGNVFKHFNYDTMNAYRKASNKLKKFLIQQNPTIFFNIHNLKLNIQPEGFVQERVLNLAAFSNEDLDKMIRLLYKQTTPLVHKHLYIRI
jgi:bacillithiol biosynthesis cysteine-adding enzyme BshC